MRHGATLAMDDEAQMSATTAREEEAHGMRQPRCGAQSEAVSAHGMVLRGRRLLEAVVDTDNLWRARARRGFFGAHTG